MTTLWDDLVAYLDRKMLWADELAAPYLCSVGCHIADLRQQERNLGILGARPPFWVVSGDDESVSLSVLSIAPSGLSKTYASKPWISRGRLIEGLLPKKHIPSKFGGTITEAGYVGTIRSGEKDEGPVLTPGLVDHFRNGIVMFDEASHIFHAEKVDQHVDLINNVMRSISERFVSKDLANGPVYKETCLTPWFASQDGRFELTGGLARRIVPSLRYWTGADVRLLMKNRDRRGNLAGWEQLEKQRERLSLRLADLRRDFDPVNVVLPEETSKWLNEHCRVHTTRFMAEKMMLGHDLLENGARDEVVLEITDKNEGFLLRALSDIRKLAYMDQFIIFGILRQYHEEGVTEEKLWDEYQIVTTYGRGKEDFRKRLSRTYSESLIRTEGKGAAKRLFPARMEI